MIRRLLILFLLVLALPAAAQDRASQRWSPGNTMCVNGVVLDTCAPIYSPPSGSYTIKYTGSASPTGTDDYHILTFTGSSPATYTFPQSTSSVFPPGHGAGVKNLGSAPLTVTATTSTIAGAPGVVNGSPAALGGAFVLLPGGEAWLTANTSNNYAVTGFLAGTWYQYANNVASLQWTGLSGYLEYDLHCSGLLPATAGDQPVIQLAYSGTFQSAGYYSVVNFILTGSTAPLIQTSSGAGDAYIPISGGLHNSTATTDGAVVNMHLTFAGGSGAGSLNTVSGVTNYYDNNTPGRASVEFEGAGPASTSAVTGIQIYNNVSASNLTQGMCWLRPSL